MEIKIIKHLSNQHVRVLTKYGELNASWAGILPPLESNKHVEVEIEDEFIWGNNIVISQIEKFEIVSNGTICIIGKLESSDDDGYTVIRMGDSIISIIAKGRPPSVGEYVRLEVINIKLYDIGV